MDEVYIVHESAGNKASRYFRLFFGASSIIISLFCFMLGYALAQLHGSFIEIIICCPGALFFMFIGFYIMATTGKLLEIRNEVILVKVWWKKISLTKDDIDKVIKPFDFVSFFSRGFYYVQLKLKSRDKFIFKTIWCCYGPDYALYNLLIKMDIRVQQYVHMGEMRDYK